MALMRDETFGPSIGIMRVRDAEEGVRLMNDSAYGLTASIWTRDFDRGEALARAVEAGTVFLNRCDYLDPAMPWTGVKDSGHGTSLSRYGFLSVTRPKNYHSRVQW
jgi:acyl-CoA reductase-like NAD-dependent aldehyde dehydrogenase